MEMCKETYEIETESEKKEVIEYILNRAAGKSVKPPEAREISKFKERPELVTEDNKYGL